MAEEASGVAPASLESANNGKTRLKAKIALVLDMFIYSFRLRLRLCRRVEPLDATCRVSSVTINPTVLPFRRQFGVPLRMPSGGSNQTSRNE